MEMKFFVIFGLGIFSIFLQQTKSQVTNDGSVDLPLELVSRAAVGSKYHGRNKRGDSQPLEDPVPTEDLTPTDANVEPSLMQFSFLPPPPRRSEFPRYSADGQSLPWQKPHQKNNNYNVNWNQQPVRYDERALSSKLHPPPEPSPAFHSSQRDDHSVSIFENRPSPIPFNPYIRDYRPHITKVENFTPSGNRNHVAIEQIPDDVEQQDDYVTVYEENPSSQGYYIPDSNPRGQIETVLEENPSETEGQHERRTQSTDKADEPIETNSRKSVQPLNLAALLAGARTIGSGIPIDEKIHEQTPSKNRHNLKEYSKASFNPVTEYYDDTLYDEFVDTYFDPDAETLDEKVIPEAVNNHEDPPRDTKPTTIEKPLNFWPTPSKDESTSPKTSTSTSTSTSTASTTTSTAAVKLILTTSSGDKTTHRSVVNTPPISLSEVIQEMGISLPVFLGTLTEYGFTLKEFTAKLQEKSLSKLDFRRTNGDVKKMFAMIDAIPNRTAEKLSPSTSTFSTSAITSTTSSTLKPITSVAFEELEEISTESTLKDPTVTEIAIKAPTRPPLIFGSNKGGLGLANKGSKDTKTTIGSNAFQNSSKLPVAIELDLTSISKNNGLSTIDLLQDFNSMFNFTEVTETRTTANESATVASTIATTLKPRLSTLPIRPYHPEPPKPKVHRPLGYEHGWWNKERNVVNSRLSSTARPTLRPPYVPPPPKIIDGEHSSSEFGSAILIDKSQPVVKNIETNTETNTKKNSYQSNHNAKNIYSKIRSGDPDAMGVATRSAIMAAGILGGVALSVFIAIFIVVKYKSYNHRNRRRTVLTLPSDSSTSSLPPIYTTRSCIALSKESYRTSGFWNTLKKRFDPYSLSTSPTSIRDPYIYSAR